jgi:hypothetical protein
VKPADEPEPPEACTADAPWIDTAEQFAASASEIVPLKYGSVAVNVPEIVGASPKSGRLSRPVTVTGIVLEFVPSEIDTVVVPAVAELTVKVPVEAPDLDGGAMLTMLPGELVAEKVPVKFVSVAVAVNDVLTLGLPVTLIVCAALGATESEPAVTVIEAAFVWL